MNERLIAQIRLLAFGATLSLCLMGTGMAARGADLAWTRNATSAGLQREHAPVAVAFAPQARRQGQPVVPRGAIITAVYASRDYASSAQVATDLCQDPERGPCISITGRSLTTHAFDGRSASNPLWLVHRVVHWGSAHAPLFVRGTVTVWFTVPTRHQE